MTSPDAAVPGRQSKGFQVKGGGVDLDSQASSGSCKSTGADGGQTAGGACHEQRVSLPPRKKPEMDDVNAFRMNGMGGGSWEKWFTNVRKSKKTLPGSQVLRMLPEIDSS